MSRAERAEFDRKWRERRTEMKRELASQWEAWCPRFADYGVVVLNYNGEMWPEPVRDAFVDYVRRGGGVVVVHAADNSFGRWEDYNRIIGIGGWGGRNEKSGPYLRWRDGRAVREAKPGPTAGHGAQHEYVVVTRAPDHPVMKGMPPRWRHARDELYHRLRGPAENVTFLASAYSDPKTRGTGEHEPVMLAIRFGEGRSFHTVLGHGATAMSGVGFQEYLRRGAEWAATGRVTLPPPGPGELTEERAATKPVPQEVMRAGRR
jgi:type 1 glutamine amidotransferase